MCITSYGYITYADDMSMTPVDPVSFDDISNQVRAFCTERLYELERGLRPLVDGTFGEVVPGHVTGYLGVMRELGRLYQTHERPRGEDTHIPAAKVQALLAAQEQLWMQRMDEAVAAARASVLAELSTGRDLSIESAKSTVLARLDEFSKRQDSR